MKDKKEIENDLIFALNKEDKKEKLVLNEENRNIALSVIGVKGTRKSSYILPTFAVQSIVCGDFVGSTYITTGVDDSYTIIAIARRYKRKTQLEIIKPSISAEVYEEIINDKPYDFNRMNHILDYSRFIREKKIVVIDAEEYRYGELAQRFIKKAILHLYICMQNTKITLDRKHYLYIDEADNYMKELLPILAYGDKFNVFTTLFLMSREYLKENDKKILDLYSKNIILLSDITEGDKEFFGPMIGDGKDELYQNPNLCYYSIISKNKQRKSGLGLLASELDDKAFNSLNTVAERVKKSDNVDDKGAFIAIASKIFNDEYYRKTSKSSKNIMNVDNEEKIEVIEEEKIENKQENEEKLIDEVIIKHLASAKEPYNGEKFNFTPTDAQTKYFNLNNPNKKEKNNNNSVESIEDKKEKNIRNSENKNILEKKDIDDEEDFTVKITEIPEEPDPFEEALSETFEKKLENGLEEQEEHEEIKEDDFVVDADIDYNLLNENFTEDVVEEDNFINQDVMEDEEIDERMYDEIMDEQHEELKEATTKNDYDNDKNFLDLDFLMED